MEILKIIGSIALVVIIVIWYFWNENINYKNALEDYKEMRRQGIYEDADSEEFKAQFPYLSDEQLEEDFNNLPKRFKK